MIWRATRSYQFGPADPRWRRFLRGTCACILLTVFAIVIIGPDVSAYYRRHAEAAERDAHLAALDAGHRAAVNTKPAPDELKGPIVFIDLKNDKDGFVITAGDGTIMMHKPRSELKPFLGVMVRDGKTKAIVRSDADLPFKDLSGVLEDVKTVGFDNISLKPLAPK